MNEKYRILLADDHPLLTAGLKLIIEEWDEFTVVGIVANGVDAVEQCEALRPNLVLMDMQMPKLSGFEAASQIKSVHPEIKILALTTFEDSETVAGALQAGCDGFLLKVIEKEKLRAALLSVLNGLNVYDENVMRQYKATLRSGRELEFSDREKEILRCIQDGLTNAEIAQRLSLRVGTVKNLVSLLLSKTSCISRAQLKKYVSENHVLD